MTKVSKLKNPWFQHDLFPLGDKKIIKLIDIMGNEGYGLFWRIVEFMHKNELNAGEENLIAGKENAAKIKDILNDFDLFRIENGKYISDRILRNIEEQEEKSKKSRKAVSVRWLLSLYSRTYKEVFEISPVLSDDEKQALIKYDETIEDFRTALPDIIYTLQFIKFDGGVKYNPRSNWLLTDNNLAKVYHGEFGALKHRKKSSVPAPQAVPVEEADDVINPSSICNKIDAIRYICTKLPENFNYKMMPPTFKELTKRFDITIKELNDYRSKTDA